MRREENIDIFQDTLRIFQENECLIKATKVAQENQQVIPETEILDDTRTTLYDNPATVIVSKKRSFEAASAYKDQKVCVHNFASASNPGGGVKNRAKAQEVCLCRGSNLYLCLKMPKLWDDFYLPHRTARNPLHNDDIIYTPGVRIIKSDTATPKLLPKSQWFDVDVITCAAPNLRERPGNSYNSGDGSVPVKITDKELLQLHEKRLRKILDVAYIKGNEIVILGAFGCGAFSNNPYVVATAAKNVIKDYLYKFKTIEFAIYCNPRDDSNYKTFMGILS